MFRFGLSASTQNCYLCHGPHESHDHLFFECPFSNSSVSAIAMMRSGLKNHISSLYLVVAVHAIWKERNGRKFTDEKHMPSQTQSKILEKV